jgi:hypothetical protein
MIPDTRAIIASCWQNRHDKAFRPVLRAAIELAQGEKRKLYSHDCWRHAPVEGHDAR